MITLIYYYVKKIIIFLIFTSFVQILFLNNKYKNYLQLVLNLILIFVMIQPLQTIFKYTQNGNLQNYIQIVEESDFDFNEEYYTEIQNEIIVNLFEENIKLQTQKLIQDYEIVDFNVVLAEDDKYQTIIKNMDITLTNNKKIKPIYVKPFSKKYENDEEQKSTEVENIKNLISNFYNLSLENINILII